MYDVTLVNLAADARSAAVTLSPIDRPGLSTEEMRRLLQDFCELDPVQNSVADPEIRVQTRSGKYLLRTGQKKLFLYDILSRERPALVLTVPEVIAELDGSAAAARLPLLEAPLPPLVEENPTWAATPPSPAPANRKLLGGMFAVAGLLLGAIVFLALPADEADLSPPFSPLEPAELAALRPSLAGVYMTGSQPGQHGIVIMAGGDLKIFELNAQVAPSVILDTFELGRLGPKLCLATNQPGGFIEVTGRDTLVYCGEIYQRIP